MKADNSARSDLRATRRTAGRYVVVAGAFTAILGGGCSIVAGLDEFDGARVADSSTFDSQPQDAATDPSDRSLGQASSDTGSSAPDATPTESDGASDADGDATNATANAADASDADGGKADATDASDASIPGDASFCVAHAGGLTLYCRDFDEGTSVTSGWSNAFSILSSAAVDTTDFVSAPASLVVSTQTIDAGQAQTQLTENVQSSTGISIQFQLRVANLDPNATDIFFSRIQVGGWYLAFEMTGTSNARILEVSTTDAGTSYTSHTIPQPATLDAWTNVDIVIDTVRDTLSVSYETATSAATTVLSNDVIAPIDPTTGTCATPPCKWPFGVTIGADYIPAPAQAMTFHYDNLLVQTLPAQ